MRTKAFERRCLKEKPVAAAADGERGSALLIVLLFAAMVAIFLYKEIPVVATEAKRQQEQVLVDRGMQYQRAIQLFYRKMGRYPPTIDALENTNNIRFLRKRYKDPLTGEDNWRLLHMGPSGPIDSLVKPLNQNGSGQPFGQNATNQDGFGQSSFGQSGFGAAAQNANQTGPQAGQDQNAGNATADISPTPNRRPPAVSATGSNGGDTGGQTDPNETAPVSGGQRPAIVAGGNGLQTGADPNQQQAGQAGGQSGQNAGQPNGQPGGTSAGVDPNSSVANQILRTPGPTITPQFQQTSSTPANPFSGGNLGGVASRGKGHSLKVINDQTDYSKWEFVYDFRKDTSTGQPAAIQPVTGVGNSGGAFSGASNNGASNNQNTASQTSQPPTAPAPATSNQ